MHVSRARSCANTPLYRPLTYRLNRCSINALQHRTSVSAQETKLLSISFCKSNESLHLLLLRANVFAKRLDDCISTECMCVHTQ